MKQSNLSTVLLLVGVLFVLVTTFCCSRNGAAQEPPDPHLFGVEFADYPPILVKRAFIGGHSYLVANKLNESVSIIHDEGCENPVHQK